MKTRKPLLGILLLSALALGATQLEAQARGGYGPGYHMMQGYGPGYAMMGGGWAGDCAGFAGGYAMGPGMMYGYGAGGYGMGPGMMYGYGGGYGPGPAANLTAEQRAKIDKIQQALQRKQWALMNEMHDAYGAGYNAQDENQARDTYKKLAGLREQMFNNGLEAQREIDAVLSGSQQAK